MDYGKNKFMIVLSSILLIGLVGIVISISYLEYNTVNADEYVVIAAHDDTPQLICNVNVETFYTHTSDMLSHNNNHEGNLSLFVYQHIDYSQNSRKISQIMVSADDLAWKNGTTLDSIHLLVQFNKENTLYSLAEDVTFAISENNLKAVHYFLSLPEESMITQDDFSNLSTDITLMAMCD